MGSGGFAASCLGEGAGCAGLGCASLCWTGGTDGGEQAPAATRSTQSVKTFAGDNFMSSRIVTFVVQVNALCLIFLDFWSSALLFSAPFREMNYDKGV